MEEQSERKDVVGVVAKEPIKTEGLVPSPDTSERSEGASSPPPNCSICLGKLINTSFTDSCLHQFCFTCLLQWSKIKTECPLCKQIFKSIIHNVRSEEDYDQYHVPRELASQMPSSQVAASLDVNFELVGGVGDVGLRRFVYRTTMTPNRRFGVFGSLLNPEQVARRAQIPNILIPSGMSREERRFRRVNPISFRRNVYTLGEWSNLLPDVYGRFRECSAEYYRRHPEELNRLIPWINRELQTLLNANEPHIAYVLRVVMDALTRYDMRGAEFRDTVRPYFGQYTDHFAHELLNYARTNFDLIGFDQYVTYPTRGHGVSNDYVTRVVSPNTSSSSTSSDDSDIRVIDQTIDVSHTSADIPSVGPHIIDMPGPSTVGETFHVPRMASGGPDVLTISSSSSSSEECAVIGYVKPRHERTPEIIELVSSDAASEPSNNYVDSCRKPPIHENEAERAGPSREERRRTTRESCSQRMATTGNRELKKSSRRRWSTTSSSTTTSDDSTSEYSRHRRKKTFRNNAGRTRVRDNPRATRSRLTTERQRASRSTSKTRKRQASNSSSSNDIVSERNLRRKISDRTEILRETFVSTGSESSSSSTSSSDSSATTSENCRTRKFGSSKVRNIEKYTKNKINSRIIVNSSSSEISDEEKCRVRRSRRRISSQETSLTPTRMIENSNKDDQEPVHLTILRKDGTNPNGWYTKKKSCRGKIRSSSSSSSTEPEVKLRVPRRITLNAYKERREAANPGCSGERESSRNKSDRVFVDQEDGTENENSTDVTNDTNSRCSAISGRTRAKERSRGKICQNKRKIRSETSESSESSRERVSNTTKNLGTRNVHGKRKYEDSRDDQAGRKEERDDRERKTDRSRKSVSYEKRNEKHRDQEERKKEKSKSVEDKKIRARADNYSRRYDQEGRNEAKKHDQEPRNDRAKHDQEPRNDRGKKHDQEPKNDRAKKHETEPRNDHDKKHDTDRENDHGKKHDGEPRNDRSKRHDQDRENDHTKKNYQEPKNDYTKKHHQDRENDHTRKHDQEERNDHAKKYDQIANSENLRKNNDQTMKNGTKRKDCVRRNDELSRENDQQSRHDPGAGSSKHSQNDKDSPSKDKYKRKKKLKRRRSRSESKNESRNTRCRMARSSSCTAPMSNRDV